MLTVVLIEAAIILLGAIKMFRPGRYDGSIDIIETPEKKTFSLEYDGDPDEIDKKKSVLFKVNKPSP